ncbi:unnamed protein product [Didymodactylos carnosus]|uniref:Uncharacterized protein n=1 Tax=Didymodactylos carnosus TaxID=1234261 RepID=A0A813USA5_9BILA|nr:unnamed protein product [Didymodactylos carnosus]CAF0833161.1 unnamed protein product [Didymodactylos carnosus]CAF3592982.1 unnamed protein product [Didymodactylos carnosus]CAF3620243.1 unnamed protein product [Didymodactylos carnosus]
MYKINVILMCTIGTALVSSPFLTNNSELPTSIDSFEFLYQLLLKDAQLLVKDLSFIYKPCRDILALLAGCYLLKKILPLPYRTYRILKLYFFPYQINPVLVKIPLSNTNNTSDVDYSEHWAILNDAATPCGYAFAQNLANRGYNLILVSTDELKDHLEQLSSYIQKTYSIRTVTVLYRWNNEMTNVEDTLSASSLTVGQISLVTHNTNFHRVGSFDRFETIENIARSSNLVLYINCTRPFDDRNLSKTLNPCEMQTIINNYLVPPMQLAYLILPYMSVRSRPAYVLNVMPHRSCMESSLHNLLRLYFNSRKQDYSNSGLLHFQTVYLPPSWIKATVDSHSLEIFRKLILFKYEQNSSSHSTWGSCHPKLYIDTILRQLGRTETSSGHWLVALQLFLLSCLPKFISHYLMSY